MLGRQFEQLKMFMSPREISGYVDTYGDYGANPQKGAKNPKPPHEALPESGVDTRYKVRTARRSGLHHSVVSEGVKKPVEIVHSERQYGEREVVLANGHHRTLTQSAADPDRLMPVLHSPGWEDRNITAFNVRGGQTQDPTGDKKL